MKRSMIMAHLAIVGLFFATLCIFNSARPEAVQDTDNVSLEERVAMLEDNLERLEGSVDKNKELQKEVTDRLEIKIAELEKSLESLEAQQEVLSTDIDEKKEDAYLENDLKDKEADIVKKVKKRLEKAEKRTPSRSMGGLKKTGRRGRGSAGNYRMKKRNTVGRPK